MLTIGKCDLASGIWKKVGNCGNNSFLEIGSILCSAKSTLDAIPGRLW